jgi:hypothetical protein
MLRRRRRGGGILAVAAEEDEDEAVALASCKLLAHAVHLEGNIATRF